MLSVSIASSYWYVHVASAEAVCCWRVFVFFFFGGGVGGEGLLACQKLNQMHTVSQCPSQQRRAACVARRAFEKRNVRDHRGTWKINMIQNGSL